MFLSEVAHKSFCLKFSGLISKLKILKKSYLSLRIFKVQTYIRSLFKAKKIYGAPMKPSKLFCIKDTKNFAALLFFFNSGMQLKIPAGKCDRYHVGWKWSTQRLVTWRLDEQGTHKHAHGSWIVWSVSHVCSKTMHSLSCITLWLPYINLCYIDSRFFLLLEQSRTALLGCLLTASHLHEAAHWQ